MMNTARPIPYIQKQVALPAYFLVLVMMGMSSGFLPQWLQCVDAELVEFADSSECDSEGQETEKKASKNKDYVKSCFHYIQHAFSGLYFTGDSLNGWVHPIDEILTPPPERV